MNRIINDVRYVVLLVIGLILFAIASFCTRFQLVDSTKNVVFIDWSKRGEGITIPTKKSLSIDGKIHDFHGDSIVLPDYFPGTYEYSVYSKQDDITVTNNIATVVSNDGVLDSMPDWFFSHFSVLEYSHDCDVSHTCQMVQQIRELRILLQPQDGMEHDILHIEARLSGTAESWDLESNTPLGDPLIVVLPFERQTDGSWLAVVRLIGIIGDSQMLSGELILPNNSKREMIFASNLSAHLADFNANKHEVMSLVGTINGSAELAFDNKILDLARTNNDGELDF